MVADARHQLDPVGQLDEVVVGPKCERLGLDRRLLLRRQDDDREILEAFVGAHPAKHLETVDVGHHEVEEDDRRTDLGGPGQCRRGLPTIVEIERVLPGEHPPDRLADDRLVVNEEHHTPAGGGRQERGGATMERRGIIHGDDSLGTGGGGAGNTRSETSTAYQKTTACPLVPPGKRG